MPQSADKPLAGTTVAFLCNTEGTERVELIEPWDAVKNAGGTPRLVAPRSGEIQLFDHLTASETFPVDDTLDSANPDDYDAIVLPGGVANPDQLRTNSGAVDFAASFARAGKPVAVICHGPWTLIESGVLHGRTITSWPSLRTDLTNAGANWVDEQVHVDHTGPGVLISSRKPDDLKAFTEAIVDQFAA